MELFWMGEVSQNSLECTHPKNSTKIVYPDHVITFIVPAYK